MQRYFAKQDEDQFSLKEEDCFHLIKVMRSQIGDTFELVNEEGVFVMQIDQIRPLSYHPIEKKEKQVSPFLITLYYCLPKGDKFELVLQKATELGVHKIVGLISSRTIVRLEEKEREKKSVRYQKILKEASEQSHRDTIPIWDGIHDFSYIANHTEQVAFIADEDQVGTTTSFYQQLCTLQEKPSIAILIGAEGGFSRDEVQFAKQHGFVPVSLGKRILRSETAAIASVAILSFFLERD